MSATAGAPARAGRARPHVPGRDALPRAHRARDRAARARGPRPRRRSGDRCCGCRRRSAHERVKRAEAAELIDFLGLGRYADRFIAELSTGTRRIVELASVLAVAPRVICLDEPTAGVAQREAEAFGPLIKRVQQELDATLVVVEHDLPLILSISDRIYCMEAGRGDRAKAPRTRCATTRSSSRPYLGTDDRAIQRSNAPSYPAVVVELAR